MGGFLFRIRKPPRNSTPDRCFQGERPLNRPPPPPPSRSSHFIKTKTTTQEHRRALLIHSKTTRRRDGLDLFGFGARARASGG